MLSNPDSFFCKILSLSRLWALEGRAEVAEAPLYLLLLVPDRAVVFPVLPLNPKATRKGHSFRVSGQAEDEHGKCPDEIIKERMGRVRQVGDILAFYVTGETTGRDHSEVFTEKVGILQRSVREG